MSRALEEGVRGKVNLIERRREERGKCWDVEGRGETLATTAEKAVFGFTGLTHSTLYCLATNDDVSTIT